MFNKLYSALFPLIVSFVAACLVTWPSLLNLSSNIPGYGTDGYQVMWNSYHLKKQLLQLNNPFYTDHIFYPIGTNLFFHWYGVGPSTVSLIFSDYVLFTNFYVIFSLTLISFFTHVVLKLWGQSPLLSVAGGVIFINTPIIHSFIITQHYYFLSGVAMFPLLIVGLNLFFRKFSVKALLIIILSFWGVFLSDYNITILWLLLLFSFCLVYFKSFINIFSDTSRSLLLIFVLLGLLFLPLLLYSYLAIDFSAIGNRLSSQSGINKICNASIEGYFIPYSKRLITPDAHIFAASFFSFKESGDTPSYYVGVVLFLLFVVGMFRIFYKRIILKNEVTGVLIFGFLCYLLSFGSEVRIGPQVLFADKLTLFYWFSQLPLMGVIGCTLRYAVGTQFMIVIVATFGLGYFHQFKWRWLSLAGIVLLLLWDFLLTPMPLQFVEKPKIYSELAELPRDRALLELPSGITESTRGFGYDYGIDGLHSKQMFYQSIHEHDRLGGYISRVDDKVYDYFKSDPIMNDLWSLTSHQGQASGFIYDDSQIEKYLEIYNIGYIIIAPVERSEQYQLHTENIFYNFISEKKTKDGYVMYILKQ